MKKYLKFLIVVFSIIYLFFTSSTFAAETFFEVKNSEIEVGDKFEVKFILNTENEDINAIEGKVVFSETLLKVEEIRDGNSIINFWIDRPMVGNSEVSFSGIIPGGYSGEQGLIFSLIFRPSQKGQGFIDGNNIKILLNDGQGKEAKTMVSGLQFTILESTAFSKSAAFDDNDIDRPEAFEPIVTSNPEVFEGRYFLVFSTQDKESGINYYEVCEGSRACNKAESPYLLQNQNLDQEIVIKAVDNSGNARVVTIKPLRKNYLFIIIIVLIILACLCKILWKKQKK